MATELSHERNFLLGEIQCLLKDTFSISQDADFIVHEPANLQDVYSYEYKDGPGSNTQNLTFDLKHGSSTLWNTVWRAAQPKVTAKGIFETGAEVEERLIVKRDKNLKSKYLCRTNILEQIIELKKDGEDEDLPAWQWLQNAGRWRYEFRRK
ncbi:hypothetical protein BDR06DRAFT_969432 [Suillus hirtellus]|nr:hypothetical protein BDR06DRAFT_969432 [Suillus hirtellus]